MRQVKRDSSIRLRSDVTVTEPVVPFLPLEGRRTVLISLIFWTQSRHGSAYKLSASTNGLSLTDCVEIGPRSVVSNVLQHRFLTISLLDEVGEPKNTHLCSYALPGAFPGLGTYLALMIEKVRYI